MMTAGLFMLWFGAILAAIAACLDASDVVIGGAVTAAIGAYVACFAHLGSF